MEQGQTATVGELRIDGAWFCWTLEDRVRSAKVKHETAIPAGEYIVTLTQSARFGTVLPEVHDVPEFSGIRIHAGNTAADTSGCILVGMSRRGERIGNSREALANLMQVLQQAASEVIVLKIHQPDAWPKWGGRQTAPALRPQPIAPAPAAGTGPLVPPTPPGAGIAPPISAPVFAPPAPVVGGSPDDPSRQVTRDGGRAWVTTLLSWVSGISASACGFLHNNQRLLLIAFGVVAAVTILFLLRSLILDVLRMKYGADPGKYNVH